MTRHKDIERLFFPLREQALADLADLVNSNSFTRNIQGLCATADIIADIAQRNGVELQKIPAKGEVDGASQLVRGVAKGSPFIGVVGHFDTVHPPESPFTRFADAGDTLTGPGVQDMKSGIVAVLYGLRLARELTGRDPLPVKIVFNCDEEIGSPDSRPLIEDMMRGANAVFVFEGKRAKDNAVVTSRKGIIMGSMTVTGKASHAGEAPQDGANSIVEAAHKIAAMDALTDHEKGITVTTGKISGGEVANQIPDHCESTIDIRFRTAEDEAAVKEAVQRIMATTHVPGCTTSYELHTARPAFEKSPASQQLLEQYQQAAAAFGATVGEKSAGGGSDGNLTAAIGAPTLDGVGPAGSNAHTHQEYIIKESFFESAMIFALYLAKLMETQPQGGSS